MLAITIVDGKVYEDIGRPTVFVDDDEMDKILKDKDVAGMVGKALPEGTIIGRLGERIGGVYEEVTPMDLDLDEYVVKGDFNFYEII